MTRDTVLVIGAGASYGARPHARCRPPLGKDLANYLLDWFHANAPRDGDHVWNAAMQYELDGTAPSDGLFDDADGVRAVLDDATARSSTANPIAFEQVMGELLRDGNRGVLTKINSVIAVSLLGGRCCSFPRGANLYDRLFAPLRTRLRAIITPNYDLLSEEALDRADLTHRYAGAPMRDGTDVVLYKFHGSANFFATPGSVGSASSDAGQAVKPLRIEPQTYLPSFYNDHPLYAAYPRENAFLEHKHKDGTGLAVMVTYGPGKDATDGRPYLNAIRKVCREDLERVLPSRIIAVGVSPPRGGGDDDAWESDLRAPGVSRHPQGILERDPRGERGDAASRLRRSRGVLRATATGARRGEPVASDAMPTTGWVLPGLVALVASVVTIAVGALGFLVALVAALVSKLPADDWRGRRVLRFVAGPVACAAVGGMGLLAAIGHEGSWFDDHWPVVPFVGMVVWIAVVVMLRGSRLHAGSH